MIQFPSIETIETSNIFSHRFATILFCVFYLFLFNNKKEIMHVTSSLFNNKKEIMNFSKFLKRWSSLEEAKSEINL